MKTPVLSLSFVLVSIVAFAGGQDKDFVPTGTSFEALTAGSALNPSLDDSGRADGDRFWFAPEGCEACVVSNYGGVASSRAPITNRPDAFAADENLNYLAFDASVPLYRTVVANGSDRSFEPAPAATNDVYVDMLVRFTPAGDAFAEDALEADQAIAVCYVEHADGEGGSGYTNFAVRAGFLRGANVVQTNYLCAVPAGFDGTAWHRLTIRTVFDADSPGREVGFRVYLDGSPLHDGILPSAVRCASESGITAVSFLGTGSVDDISIVAADPDFIWEKVPKDDWDIVGESGGGIRVFVRQGVKTVDFTGIELVNGMVKVGLRADRIDANGQMFGLICKDDLLSDTTFTLNVKLSDDGSGSARLADLMGQTDKPQLFVLGIGSAVKSE